MLRIGNLNGESRQVRGRCPESRRGHLWVNVPSSMDHRAVQGSTSRGHGRSLFWQRLLVAAVGHADLVERDFAHQLGKRFAGYVHHELMREITLDKIGMSD